MRLTVLATIFVLGHSSFNLANAQEQYQCYQILEGGKFNSELIDQNRDQKTFAHSWFCRQNYQSDNSAKAANLKIIYKGITGKGDYSQETHNEYKSNFCSQDVDSESISESTHIIRQIVSNEVVEAWRDCIGANTGGLICEASQPSKDELRFQIEIQDGPHDDLVSAEILTNNLEYIFDSDSSWKGPLREGDPKLIQFRRVDVNKPAIIQVNGEFADKSATCDYRIPPHDNRFQVDFERMKLSSLLSKDKLPSGRTGNTFQFDHCTVKVTESLSINRSTVSKDKNSISVAYHCSRPDHSYECDGPWTTPQDASYSGSVNAKISVSAGVLKVTGIDNPKASKETLCGKRIVDFISSLSGTALDTN